MILCWSRFRILYGITRPQWVNTLQSVPNFILDTVINIHLKKKATDIIMGTIASQITSLRIVYSTVYSDADQRKCQSSASLAFVWGIHGRPVNSPHKLPVMRKMFPFDDVMMECGLAMFLFTCSDNCILWIVPTGQATRNRYKLWKQDEGVQWPLILDVFTQYLFLKLNVILLQVLDKIHATFFSLIQCPTKTVCEITIIKTLQKLLMTNIYSFDVMHILATASNLGHKLSIITLLDPDNKVHGANIGPTWVLSAPDRPHVGPMNLAIRAVGSRPTIMVLSWNVYNNSSS